MWAFWGIHSTPPETAVVPPIMSDLLDHEGPGPSVGGQSRRRQGGAAGTDDDDVDDLIPRIW